MKKFALVSIVILSLLACGTAFAGETLTKEEVLALVSGSSYKGVSNNYTNFGEIHPDGSVTAKNQKGSSKGTWRVTDDGQYCNEWDNSRWKGSCANFLRTDKPNVFVRKAAEGGESIYTFEKK